MRSPSVLLVSILVLATNLVGSADNWRSLTPPPERETFHGAAWDANGFNLVGENGAILWSAEGNHWFPASSGLIRNLNAVATNGAIRIAVGEHGSWTRSSNGIAWRAGNQLTNSEFNGVAHGEPGFVAVGDSNTIFLSEDASDWVDSSTAFGIFRDYLDVAFGAGVYVAVGTDGAISVSSDGKIWQPYDVSADDLCAVAFSGSTWIAMTRGGEVWKSSDAMGWIEVADLSWSYGDHDLIWDGLIRGCRGFGGVRHLYRRRVLVNPSIACCNGPPLCRGFP